MTTKEDKTKKTSTARRTEKATRAKTEEEADKSPFRILANALNDAWKGWIEGQMRVNYGLQARVAKVQADLADEYQEICRELWKPVKDAHARLQEAVWTGDAEVWKAHTEYNQAVLKFQCAQRQAQIDSQRSFEKQAKNAREETREEWGKEYSSYLKAVQSAWGQLDPAAAEAAALAALSACWARCAG